MINPDNYKPNSHKYKAEQKELAERKKVEKVVKGKVKTKKKGELQKVAGAFISEDATNVKSYLLFDVLIPAAKDALADIINKGTDMILYGGESSHKKKSTSASKISYARYYDRKDDRPSYYGNRTRSGYGFEDVILESRGEAEEVLTRMDELIETYGSATVADLYDLVGITCNYTDNKYGWTNLRNAEPIRVRDGYMLKMPKALPID